MAEKKINAVVKLQLPAGKATAGPPVGSSLGPHGINIPAFTKEFNERTASEAGLIIPVVITMACGIESGSANSIKTKVATITKAQVRSIAETKMPDLNASSVESAMRMIEGTCRSMGVTITE